MGSYLGSPPAGAFRGGVRGDETFQTISALLNRGNAYAQAAGALILLCADRGDDEVTAQYCAVDAGAAMANLAVEAVSRGLISHPMAGFDVDGSRVAFDMPPQVQPFMVIAVGSLAEYASVSDDVADRDASHDNGYHSRMWPSARPGASPGPSPGNHRPGHVDTDRERPDHHHQRHRRPHPHGPPRRFATTMPTSATSAATTTPPQVHP